MCDGFTTQELSFVINKNPHFSGSQLALYKKGYTSVVIIRGVVLNPCLTFTLALLLIALMNARYRFLSEKLVPSNEHMGISNGLSVVKLMVFKKSEWVKIFKSTRRPESLDFFIFTEQILQTIACQFVNGCLFPKYLGHW